MYRLHPSRREDLLRGAIVDCDMAFVAIACTKATLMVATLLQDIQSGVIVGISRNGLIRRAIGGVDDIAVPGTELDAILVGCTFVDGVDAGVAGVDVWGKGTPFAAEQVESR